VARRFRNALQAGPAARVRGVLGDPDTGRGERRGAGPPGKGDDDGPEDGPVHYDEIEDPILDQALDVLRELARRPGKDLAGV
jgi:hypothetical protein